MHKNNCIIFHAYLPIVLLGCAPKPTHQFLPTKHNSNEDASQQLHFLLRIFTARSLGQCIKTIPSVFAHKSKCSSNHVSLFIFICSFVSFILPPQWGAADAEIKVPSGENTELKRSPFQAWSRSVYSHTYYAYCQGVLPCLFLPFQSIHLHFFQNLSQFFLCWPAE